MDRATLVASPTTTTDAWAVQPAGVPPPPRGRDRRDGRGQRVHAGRTPGRRRALGRYLDPGLLSRPRGRGRARWGRSTGPLGIGSRRPPPLRDTPLLRGVPCPGAAHQHGLRLMRAGRPSRARGTTASVPPGREDVVLPVGPGVRCGEASWRRRPPVPSPAVGPGSPTVANVRTTAYVAIVRWLACGRGSQAQTRRCSGHQAVSSLAVRWQRVERLREADHEEPRPGGRSSRSAKSVSLTPAARNPQPANNTRRASNDRSTTTASSDGTRGARPARGRGV